MSDLGEAVLLALKAHPKIRDVRLVGSRAEGRATESSDWDFLVGTDDFTSVAHDLPQLVLVLHPLAQQWDRLSERRVYMLLLRGPIKVDLIFPNEQHSPLGPWAITLENLPALDAHFWDWTLWLSSKQSRGQSVLIPDELSKIWNHILLPLGVSRRPNSLLEATRAYRDARNMWETRLDIRVSRDLEREVLPCVR